jgi:hypothetical protein
MQSMSRLPTTLHSVTLLDTLGFTYNFAGRFIFA